MLYNYHVYMWPTPTSTSVPSDVTIVVSSITCTDLIPSAFNSLLGSAFRV